MSLPSTRDVPHAQDATSVLSSFLTVDERGEVSFHDVAGLQTRVKELHDDEWAHLVAAFDADPAAFHIAYDYIRCHPIFWYPAVDETVAGGNAARTAADVEVDDLPDPAATDWTVQDGDGWAHIYVAVVRVDPATRSISDDPTANTQTEVWFEAGPWLWAREQDPSLRWQMPPAGTASHDDELDSGGDTFEAATVALAQAVRARYGDDRAVVTSPRPRSDLDVAG